MCKSDEKDIERMAEKIGRDVRERLVELVGPLKAVCTALQIEKILREVKEN